MRYPLGSSKRLLVDGQVVLATVSRAIGNMRILSWGNGHCATMFVGPDGKLSSKGSR